MSKRVEIVSVSSIWLHVFTTEARGKKINQKNVFEQLNFVCNIHMKNNCKVKSR